MPRIPAMMPAMIERKTRLPRRKTRSYIGVAVDICRRYSQQPAPVETRVPVVHNASVVCDFLAAEHIGHDIPLAGRDCQEPFHERTRKAGRFRSWRCNAHHRRKCRPSGSLSIGRSQPCPCTAVQYTQIFWFLKVVLPKVVKPTSVPFIRVV